MDEIGHLLKGNLSPAVTVAKPMCGENGTVVVLANNVVTAAFLTTTSLPVGSK